MTIQSITRTPVSLAHPEVDHRTYAEVWPELRLNMACIEQHLSGVAGEITIALVDSGVPDDDRRRRAEDRDDDGHATLLAGTIRGRKTRSRLKIDIRAIRAFSAQGWPKPEPGPSGLGGATAIRRAAEMTPKVIVLAWDTGHTTDELGQAILAVKDTAVVVIAAGNWSLDNDRHPNWPANYGEMEHVLAVMATDKHDDRASYSSYGRHSVYIAAPGVAKVDAAPSSSTLRNFGSLRDSYSEFRGTSAATAHVARLAALVLAKHPDWSPQTVKKHIGATARKVKALQNLCVTGAIADFGAALR
jgi:subtilisin family serine protease